MRVRVLLFFLMGSLSLYSQREAANWFFGKNAGLDFNSGTPRAVEDGQINTVEGCEAFSDAHGKLLFYTEGKTVWNRRHEIMPNGTELGGSFSTSQSALVIPNPQKKNIYYVFTPDDALNEHFAVSNGFNYSVVDMSKDNGLGDVIEKNVTLLERCSEKVSAVHNTAGDFYWVITQFEDRFYAYRVDDQGVDENPVVSVVGPNIVDFANTRGTIKIAPDGTKLAIAHTIVKPEYKGSFHLFDFDMETGRVDNYKTIDDSRLYYGAEFSSNSSKVYGTGFDLLKRNDSVLLDALEIVQFDLNAEDYLKEYVVHSFRQEIKGFLAGALQIGIDKKIYHAVPHKRLSVIRTPNLSGLNSDFRPFEVSLGSRSATYGLPPFIQSFFETIVTIEHFCEGDTTTFTTESTGDIARMRWNFGDPASGMANVSNEMNPSHVFSAPGTYTVTVDVDYLNGSNRQFLEFVEIAEIPLVNTTVSLVQCDVDGQDDGITTFNLMEAIPLFNNGNPDITALFFASEDDAIANIDHLNALEYTNEMDGQVVYARAFENSECFTIVEIRLEVRPMSFMNDYGTLTVCNGELALLATIADMGEVFFRLKNDFGSEAQIQLFLNKMDALLENDPLPLENHTFGPLDALTIFFRVEGEGACLLIGRADLNVYQKPEGVSEHIVELCNGKATLTAPDGYTTYVWPDGNTEQVVTVEEMGDYEVLFGEGECQFKTLFKVVSQPKIRFTNVEINDFQNNATVSVGVENTRDNEELLFSMDGGETFQTNPLFRDVPPGLYSLLVMDRCSTLEKQVLVGGMPRFFTPNGDGMNDTWNLVNPERFSDYKVHVFDRYGRLLLIFWDWQSGWDGTFNNRPMPPGDYWYTLELADGRTAKGHFTLKR